VDDRTSSGRPARVRGTRWKNARIAAERRVRGTAEKNAMNAADRDA
jgi:hypothetical protein